MADLLKQIWFLLIIEMDKLCHKGGWKEILNFDEDINERATTDVVNINIFSAFLKCTVTEFRTWAVLTVFSLYTKSEWYDK